MPKTSKAIIGCKGIAIYLPGEIAHVLRTEARLKKVPYAKHVTDIVIHRNTTIAIDRSIRKRVESYAKRAEISRDEAVNKLLKIALGYLNE